MALVKARKVGNSVSVTLPKEFGIETGQEFVIEQGKNRVLILAPKLKNPFDGETDLRMTDDFEGVKLLSNEY